MEKLSEKLVSEAVGTALLLVSIIGSGIAMDRLGEGQPAISLFVHAAVIGGALVALILAFGGISAHFNPAVSLFFALRGELPFRRLPYLVLAQVIGAVAGVVLTHTMFELPPLVAGTTARTGFPVWLSEGVCTFGLLLVIVGASRQGLLAVALGVGGFIAAGILCFSSAAFANPAVTFARSLTDSYTAIRPIDVLPFVAAQLLGAVAAGYMPGFGSGSHEKQG